MTASFLLLQLCLFLPLCMSLSGAARPEPQIAPPVQVSPSEARTAALQTTSAIQADFVQKIRALGLRCSIPVPKIIVEDVPSYGNYQSENNVILTSDWSVLNEAERAFAYRLAGPGADETTAKAVFNDVTHRWIFVHEMGHWWQACRKADTGRQPYALEYEADRIDTAYWNEVDPALVNRLVSIAQAVVNNSPNPVPQGQQVESYFNANYEKLGLSPAYPWFQARMIVDCGKEAPKPTFAQALAIG